MNLTGASGRRYGGSIMRRILTALLVAALGVIPLRPLSATGQVVILDYHTFIGNGKSGLDYTLADLGAQLDRMISLGYRIVSLDDAIAGKVEGRANIVITIDDGNLSSYAACKEVFEVRGIRPELFIYPFIIGRNRHALSPTQLKELADDGCGVGAHGFYHEYMTAKAYAKDPWKVMIEVTRPAPALERLLNTRPRLFAYPFGVGCPQVERALRDAGYEWAFSASDKLSEVDFSDPVLDHYNVPRTIVYHWNRDKIFSYLAARLKD